MKKPGDEKMTGVCPFLGGCAGCPFCEIFLGFHVCYLPAMVLREYHDVVRFLRDKKGFNDDKIELLKKEAISPQYERTLKIFEKYFLGVNWDV